MQASLGGKEQTTGQAQPGTLAARVCGFVAHCALQARGRVAAWQERRALAQELERLDDRELADVGLMRWQIPVFVKKHPTADRLLSEMLARLGLEADENLRSRLMHDDVYRNCVMCREHGRCRRWLDEAGAVADAPAFCPNAWTFRQILQAKRTKSEAVAGASRAN